MREKMGMLDFKKPSTGKEVLERYRELPDFKEKLVAVIAQGFDEKEISPKEGESSDDYAERINQVVCEIKSANMEKYGEPRKDSRVNALTRLQEEIPTKYSTDPKFDPDWNPDDTE